MPELDFGTMAAREFFLYQSQLMRGGARYTKIDGSECGVAGCPAGVLAANGLEFAVEHLD